MTTDNHYLSLAVLTRLDEYREQLGFSASKMSKLLNYKPPYWSGTINRGRDIRLHTLEHISKALRLDLRYLLYGKKVDYVAYTFNLKKLANYMFKRRAKEKTTSISRVQMSRLRHNITKDLTIKSYFDIEELVGCNIFNFATDEIETTQWD